MNNTNRSGCDSTSLLNLKAELYKKQEACKLAKASQSFAPLKRMTLKGQSVPSKKEKKGGQVKETPKDISEEEEEMLKKSRRILEAKAKIYDEIIEKKIALDEEFSDSYLVDFQRKELFKPDKEDTELKSKPDHLNGTNQSVKAAVPEDTVHKYGSTSSAAASSIYSPVHIDLKNSSLGDTLEDSVHPQKHAQFQNTPKLDDSPKADGPIHYQNVRFNEVRDHGVGYFSFSEIEKERQEQMELLNTLRQETIEGKQSVEKLKQKRQALLQSRLAKVCKRRKIDSSVLQQYTKEEEKQEVLLDEVESKPMSDIPDGGLNNEKSVSDSSTTKKVRPWDIGKSEFDLPIQIPKKKLSGAEKWIENERNERNEDFAPPLFYFDNTGSK